MIVWSTFLPEYSLKSIGKCQEMSQKWEPVLNCRNHVCKGILQGLFVQHTPREQKVHPPNPPMRKRIITQTQTKIKQAHCEDHYSIPLLKCYDLITNKKKIYRNDIKDHQFI